MTTQPNRRPKKVQGPFSSFRPKKVRVSFSGWLGFLSVSIVNLCASSVCRCCSRLLALLLGTLVEPLKLPNNMQNEEGKNMDLYIPRKCSATNRLITSKDHASVQLNIGHLDANGVYNNQFTTFALCGFIRAQGDADSAIDRLWQKKRTEIKQ